MSSNDDMIEETLRRVFANWSGIPIKKKINKPHKDYKKNRKGSLPDMTHEQFRFYTKARNAGISREEAIKEALKLGQRQD